VLRQVSWYGMAGVAASNIELDTVLDEPRSEQSRWAGASVLND